VYLGVHYTFNKTLFTYKKKDELSYEL